MHAVVIAYFGHIESESQLHALNMLMRLLLISEMVKRRNAIMATFTDSDPEVLIELVNLLESALFSFSWGDQVSLLILSLALDRRIIVYRNNFAPNNVHGYLVGTQVDRAPITLFHYINHYMYIYIPVVNRRSLIYPQLDHTIPGWH